MRTRRAVASATVALVALVGIVLVAMLADGRAAADTETNDGGAWLINRDAQAIGHVDRAARELTAVIGDFASGDFLVDQSGRTIIVHDRGASQLRVVDPVAQAARASVELPSGGKVEVFALPDGVLVADRVTGRVWRFSAVELATVRAVADETPVVHTGGSVAVAVGRDGVGVVVDEVGGQVSWIRHDSVDVADIAATGDALVSLVDSAAVVAFPTGQLFVIRGQSVEERLLATPLVQLQQPSASGEVVIGIEPDGDVVEVPLGSGDIVVVDRLAGSAPLAPIVHGGCVWAVTTAPSPGFEFCDQPARAIDGIGEELQLRLVNGWVWLNNTRTGDIYMVDQDLDLHELSDWSTVILSEVDDSASGNGGGEETLTLDPDSNEIDPDVLQGDPEGENTPPTAVDDLDHATRRGRPVVIDVLANDIDPDGDPLVVTTLSDLPPAGVQVELTAGGRAVQVTPPEDFVGPVAFNYAISDGRGGTATARVTLTVFEASADGNRPPTTDRDNATVRAGEAVVVNVLSNDGDPDGDVLLLVAVVLTSGSGEVSFTPDGQILYRPDVTSPDGVHVLEYTAMDDFGAKSTGELQVSVRPENSNQAPVPLPDVGSTVIGRAVVFNVLLNDSDPDGDLLTARGLRAIEPSDADADLSADGVFLFTPTEPGTHRFVYIASDGPGAVESQIRVEVAPGNVNRPPVAVRDELALASGQSRVIHVLENDSDPDGDVIAVVDRTEADGLTINELASGAFVVTAASDAAPRTTFYYWISDGVGEPVRGAVVVTLTAIDPVDRPPVVRPDVVDARAGRSTVVSVLDNDFDPDGGALRVVGPTGDRAELAEASVRISPDGAHLIVSVIETQQFGFSFGYDVVDEAGNRGSAVVEVRVVPAAAPNRAPIARPDTIRTQENTPSSVDVLFNDSDPDGDAIAVEGIAQQPLHGTATVLEDGTIAYAPATGYSGPDRFEYTLVDGYTAPEGVDGGPKRAVGEVLVGVMPEFEANRPPSAIDDIRIVPTLTIGDDPVTIPVLRNDSDPDGDALVVTAVTTVASGVVTVVDSGLAVEYTPPADGEAREVAFGYTISDQAGGSASAQVILDVEHAPEPIPPIAVDDTVGPLRAGTAHTFDPRTNDDPPVGLRMVPSPDGRFVIEADGSITVTVPESTVQIPYRVVDGNGLESNVANITVLVVPNQAPIVPMRTVETPFETPVEIELALGVVDPDDDVLLYALGSSVSGGSVQTVGSAQAGRLTVRFTPDTLFEGLATFDFQVDDQNGHVVAAAMTVLVGPPGNRAPVAQDGALTVTAGIATPYDLDGLVSDLDIERDPTQDALSFSVGSAQNGVVDLAVDAATGVVTISSTPDQGETSDRFTFTATDTGGEVATGSVSVTLDPADHAAPTANADSGRTLQTVPVDLLPLTNDTDHALAGLEGDGLVITEVGTTAAGATTTDGTSVTFTPDPSFFGSASFTYTIEDGRRLADRVGIGTIDIDVVGFPAQPQPPSIGSFGDRYCVITWNAPAGNGAAIDGYVIEFRDSNGGTGSRNFSTDPATNYRWELLDNATDYFFAVAAVNEAGIGGTSLESGACTPDVRPERPAAPTIAFDDQSLDLTWPDAISAGSPVINYQLEIGGGQTLETRETQNNVSAFTWTGLTNGTDYQFRVRAQNSAAADNNGWSDWSSWSASEHPLTVPTAPSKPTVSRGDRQIIIDWTEPYDGGDAISTYDIQLEGSNWFTVTAVPGANQYVWSELVNGDSVRFRIRAVNRDPLSGLNTSSSISLWSEFVTPGDVPDAPARPSAVPGDIEATVTWTAPDDQGYPILGYTIENNLGATQTASAGATSHLFTGLTNGTDYTFTVTANNAVTLDGVPGKPSLPSVSVTPVGPPFAPTITTATPGDGQVALSWTSANPNGGTLSGYEISNNGGTTWTSSAGLGTTYTWTGLADGTSYNFRVRGVNVEAGSGASSANASATTYDVPSAPGGLTASPGNGRISISWNVAGNNGSGLIEYEVLRTTGGSCSGTVINKALSPRSHTFTSLSNGTQYRVCVRARNGIGTGPWSSAVATPVAPKVVTLTRGASCAGVVFGPGDVCGATGYYVNVQISGFTPNHTYTYLCQSDDGGGTNYVTYASNVTISTNGSGNGSRINSTSGCWYGFPNGSMRVVVDGVSDTVRPWGP